MQKIDTILRISPGGVTPVSFKGGIESYDLDLTLETAVELTFDLRDSKLNPINPAVFDGCTSYYFALQDIYGTNQPKLLIIDAVTVESVDNKQYLKVIINNTATPELVTYLGTDSEKSIGVEIAGLTADGLANFVWQFALDLHNRYYDGEGVPETQGGEPPYLTTAQIKALLGQGVEIVFSPTADGDYHTTQRPDDRYAKYRLKGTPQGEYSEVVELSVFSPGVKSFVAGDVLEGKLTYIDVNCAPIALGDETGKIYALKAGTATLIDGDVVIDIDANTAEIGKPVTGTWNVYFTGGKGDGGSVPPGLINQVETNKTNIDSLDKGKVDKVSGKSLIEDSEIARLKDVKNYDDTQVKQDINTLKSTKADNALTPVALEGTPVTVGPNKYYTYTTAVGSVINLQGWDGSKLESSSLELNMPEGATVEFSPAVDAKGDKLEASATYQCMINHNASGFILVAIKRATV